MPTSHQPRRSNFPIARVTAALSLAAWLLQRHGESAPEAPPVAPAPEASVEEEPPSWVVDVVPGQEWWGFTAGGRVVPPRPFKEQKRPPCALPDEVAINDGCWLALRSAAPCGPLSFEYEGRCYRPVKATPAEPSTMTP